MPDLFDDAAKPDVDWYPDCLTPAVALGSMRQLTEEVAWQQDWIRTPRGCIPLPRLTAWQGDPDAVYVYSGIRNVPAPWTPTVLELRGVVERIAATRFNSVLLNRYRHGNDSMGWHADDEASLGPRPVIASAYQRQPARDARAHPGRMEAPCAEGPGPGCRAYQFDLPLGYPRAIVGRGTRVSTAPESTSDFQKKGRRKTAPKMKKTGVRSAKRSCKA
ncbi:hypothetical protein DFQ28_003042 [Apophysomyces sp. BC1034]|nr:hypothetical protein DFQ28_003042 [Apophysomyces sp. BC1034]